MSKTNAQFKLNNLKLAFQSLEEFSKYELQRNMEKAAFVKAFEFTFELCWKILKLVAEERGLRSSSPKEALSTGILLGLLVDEGLWLQMKDDRNTTAHTYSVDYLPEMLERMKNRYVPEIKSLIEKLMQQPEFFIP
jgi:nucleotidyltransferase substrate binding protein (TIGR01987 family)